MEYNDVKKEKWTFLERDQEGSRVGSLESSIQWRSVSRKNWRKGGDGVGVGDTKCGW